MKIGNRFFDTQNHTYIMGILNITPDSFSDGGKWNHLDEALRHTEAMIADGADIIDIGGESTRPGHTPVSAEEEAQRVLPVIEAVRKRFDIPISVDTFKSSVAESAIQAGADLVNDIWGLKYDSEMGAVIAKYDAACCLMHNKSNTEYNNFLIDMLSETQECVNLARKAGIKDEKIILDPGVGFGKTFEMNLETMKHLELFKNLGFPVLLGTSRKSMIGLALDLPVDQRVEGTLATSVIGVIKGCSFVRVHDVKENRRVIQMTEAILVVISQQKGTTVMDETRFDKIEIKELEIFANHGVYPEENVLGQKFVISATLFTHTRQAGLTDDLSASINYGEVSHMITDFTRNHTFKLLEALAENLAEMLLDSLSGLEQITLKIEKPWAPVGLPLKTVSVEITRKWHTAYIAFGSNMGDKKLFIDNGIRGLKKTKGCRIEAVSDYLVTEPYGVTDQDEFLNGVLKMRTLLSPEELLERLHQLEQEANRERIIHWGPRTLDLDILFYDQEIIDTADLHIPHPDMQNRDFVLAPMNQIAPYLRHPVLNQTISQLLNILLCR